MGLLLAIALILVAAAIVHITVRFLEPDRASKGKAVLLVILFAVWNNVRAYTGLEIPWPLEWFLYFCVTAVLVWTVFRLKPMHCVTVGSFYVVGRYLLIVSLSGLPEGFWLFFGTGAT